MQRSAGTSVRVSVVLRDRADARLLALDDSLRRRPFRAGKKSCHASVAVDSHAVSGRLALAGAIPRFGGRSAALAIGASESWTVLHQHSRRPAHGAAHPAAPA